MSLSYEQSVLVREYLSPRAMAVVGASNGRDKFGNFACRELKSRDFRIFPVNPHEKEICSERCYRTINELSGRIDRILIVLPPILTEQIIMHAQPVRSYHLLHRWWAMSVHSQFSMVRLHCKGES